MKPTILAALIATVWLTMSTATATDYIETPMFADDVAAGKLPAVAERLPATPAVVKLDGEELSTGRHGGELRMLVGREKDVRMLVVYGYARLVGYDTAYEIKPDLLASVEVKEGP